MTLREKQEAMLADLLRERAQTEDTWWWAQRLDQKIADLRAAMEGK